MHHNVKCSIFPPSEHSLHLDPLLEAGGKKYHTHTRAERFYMYQSCTTAASQCDAPSVVVAMTLDDFRGSCALSRGFTANLAALRSVNQGSYVAHTYWM
jgi:hypothetical protein